MNRELSRRRQRLVSTTTMVQCRSTHAVQHNGSNTLDCQKLTDTRVIFIHVTAYQCVRERHQSVGGDDTAIAFPRNFLVNLWSQPTAVVIVIKF